MSIEKTDDTWEVLSSRVLIKDEWLTVRSDTCALSSGEIIDPYVFEYPNWVNIFALTETNEIVLIKQYRHGIGRILLELPGGYVSSKDRTIEEAARRELYEETGYNNGKFKETGKIFCQSCKP